MNPNNAVNEIMTKDLITIHPNTTIKAIEEIFNKNDFHHLPVVTTGSVLVGMVSKNDLERFHRWLTRETTGKTLSDINVETLTANRIMADNVLSIDPEDTIGLAADIFMANKFHALPVVDDGMLVGMLTVHDLLLYCFESAVATTTTDEMYE